MFGKKGYEVYVYMSSFIYKLKKQHFMIVNKIECYVKKNVFI